MKAIAFLLLLAALSAHAALPVPPAPQVDAHAWLLIDATSGISLAEKNADMPIEPASLTKLMTAYLVFSALKEGRLTLDQQLPVSAHAWKQEGSRMFLDPRKPARVDDLVRGMIVQSGNDACVTLAEAIAGSEDGFVSMMNEMATRMGMSNTHFMDATGLPQPRHRTTARDLATLSRALIHTFPEFYKFYSLKEFRYNGITQTNRNRLLLIDPSVDGLKTGHTESAGYCLIASAHRDQRRLLSVVLGANSDSGRTMESQKLLNYGFQFFETVRLYPGNQAVSSLRIYKGEKSLVRAGFPDDFYVTVPRGSSKNIQAQVLSRQPLLAPIRRGERIATLRLSVNGQPLAEYPLAALDNIAVAGLIGRTWDNLLLMFK